MEYKDIHIVLVEIPRACLFSEEVLQSLQNADPHIHMHRTSDPHKILEQFPGHPIDICICDIETVKGPGVQLLLKMVTDFNGEIPLLAILDSEEHLSELSQYGVVDYLIRGECDAKSALKAIISILERFKMKKELSVVTNELKAVNNQLERLSLLDPLTGLLSRQGLQEAFSRELKCMAESGSPLYALILDLDDFKTINVQLGHAWGDVLLKEISKKIKASLRHSDAIARVSGDEFVILMPHTRLTEGIHVAEKLRLAIKNTSFSQLMNHAVQITASFGLVMITEDILNVDDLIARCHKSLQKSKDQGKNRLSCDTAAEYEHPLAAIMTAFRSKEGCRVLKQPIFSLDTQVAPIGYEFLSRLKVEGYEMPDDFFKVCFENSMLTWVDYHCLKNCIQSSATISNKLTRHMNIFPSTLIDSYDEIVGLFPDDRKHVEYVMELSEQQIIGDPAYLQKPISVLRKEGIKIAIDDVGFGRSCLESWIVLEPDIIKIDKRWVNGIARNDDSVRALERLLKVAKALDTQVIAEGIEWPDDLSCLKKLGVQYGQGFLLGRPA